MIPRSHWDIARNAIITKKKLTHLFLLLSSKRLANAPPVTSTEYRQWTGRRLNRFKESVKKIEEQLDKIPQSKSYIRVPDKFFKIPLKNTFELLVIHYVVTKNHDSKMRNKYFFQEFAERYGVNPTRQNKYKFNKIIKK